MNVEKIKKLYESLASKLDNFEKIGIKRQTFYDILTQKTQTKVDNLEKIAVYFNKPVGYFFDEPDARELEKENIELRKDVEKLSEKIGDLRETIEAHAAHIETLTGKKAEVVSAAG